MKADRLVFLSGLVAVFAGRMCANTIDPPGITIRPGENYTLENPTVQTLTLDETDGFGFSETQFSNDSGNTFLSASFPLTLLDGLDPTLTECDTSPDPTNPVFVFSNCQVHVTGAHSVLVTFSTQGPGDSSSGGNGITPGLSYEVLLNGGALSTCDPSFDPSRTQCGFSDFTTFSGKISTSSTPPQQAAEPCTVELLLLTGLGALAARRRLLG